jgi:hypothetical protein
LSTPGEPQAYYGGPYSHNFMCAAQQIQGRE